MWRVFPFHQLNVTPKILYSLSKIEDNFKGSKIVIFRAQNKIWGLHALEKKKISINVEKIEVKALNTSKSSSTYNRRVQSLPILSTL